MYVAMNSGPRFGEHGRAKSAKLEAIQGTLGGALSGGSRKVLIGVAGGRGWRDGGADGNRFARRDRKTLRAAGTLLGRWRALT